MAKRPKKSQKSQTNLPRRFASLASAPLSSVEDRKGARRGSRQNRSSRVIVTFAEDMEQAKEYETLLEANGIPTTIKEQVGESADTKGIAVMVPEDYLDEAHVVIESQDAYDDFYDFALEDEDEDEGDFDSELFEDDF